MGEERCERQRRDGLEELPGRCAVALVEGVKVDPLW